jgi:hypothetical protein
VEREPPESSGGEWLPDVPRVLDVVREAAADALARGAADLAVSTTTELYGGDEEFEYPVVILAPRNPAAAEVGIEVQEDIWWFSADRGPYLDLFDRPDEMTALVRAVIAGGYRTEWVERRSRLLLRPWRFNTWFVLKGTFLTEDGPITTTHFYPADRPDPERARPFQPY